MNGEHMLTLLNNYQLLAWAANYEKSLTTIKEQKNFQKKYEKELDPILLEQIISIIEKEKEVDKFKSELESNEVFNFKTYENFSILIFRKDYKSYGIKLKAEKSIDWNPNATLEIEGLKVTDESNIFLESMYSYNTEDFFCLFCFTSLGIMEGTVFINEEINSSTLEMKLYEVIKIISNKIYFNSLKDIR